MKENSEKKNSGNANGGLPNVVLNHINEHTVGGFIIFYFNSQTGRPEQSMTFDSPAHALGIQKHVSDWCEAIHEVNIQNSVNSIQAALDEAANKDKEDDEGSETFE